MLKSIAHIGITVKNMEDSIGFYKDTLDLIYDGQMIMEGKELELLTGIKKAKLKVAYFQCPETLQGPPIELLEFIDNPIISPKPQLDVIGISELCFQVSDIQQTYRSLLEKNVNFLSPPIFFDLSSQGFGTMWSAYFRDNNGTILELLQCSH